MTLITVGFTGTQQGLTDYQKRTVVSYLREFLCEDSVAVHGDCIGGDKFFAIAAAQMGYETWSRPGCDSRGNSPKRAYHPSHQIFPSDLYLIRNHRIVDDCDVLLACPKEMKEEMRSGTWATVRYARKVGKPIRMIYPEEI